MVVATAVAGGTLAVAAEAPLHLEDGTGTLSLVLDPSPDNILRIDGTTGA